MLAHNKRALIVLFRSGKATMKHIDDLYKVRHSAAHMCAQALVRLFPGTLPTIGPVKNEGFFYDVLAPQSLKESDLKLIEAEMHKISKEN